MKWPTHRHNMAASPSNGAKMVSGRFSVAACLVLAVVSLVRAIPVNQHPDPTPRASNLLDAVNSGFPGPAPQAVSGLGSGPSDPAMTVAIGGSAALSGGAPPVVAQGPPSEEDGNKGSGASGSGGSGGDGGGSGVSLDLTDLEQDMENTAFNNDRPYQDPPAPTDEEIAAEAPAPGSLPQPPGGWDQHFNGDGSPLNMSTLLNVTYPDDAELVREGAFTPQDAVDLLFQLSKTVSELLDAVKVTWWAERGTALGAVRQHGMVPWDDNVDLGVLRSDEAAVDRLLPALKKLGICVVTPSSSSIYMSWCAGPHRSSFDKANKRRDYTFPFVRVWLMEWQEGRLQNEGGADQRQADCWHNKTDVEPRRSMRFGTINVPVDHDPVPYLTRCFGQNWKTPIHREADDDVIIMDGKVNNSTMMLFSAEASRPLLDQVTDDIKELIANPSP